MNCSVGILSVCLTFTSAGVLLQQSNIRDLYRELDEIKQTMSERPKPTSPPERLPAPIPDQFMPVGIEYTADPFPHVQLDRFCLAKNIYHEARGEQEIGQYAVAQVTINRVHSDRWPNDICHVVMQPYQFSWTRNQELKWTHPNDSAWIRAQQIAADVIDHGARVPALSEALFYHADHVDPSWSSSEFELATVDSHVFYKQDLRR